MSEKQLDFETAISQLEEIIRQLEDGQVPLEKALELFTEGIRLSKLCNSRLDIVEEKVKLLLNDTTGEKTVLKDTEVTPCGGNK